MSERLFASDVLFFQRLLASDDLYRGELDGIWGRRTERAAGAFSDKSDRIRDRYWTFDSRSETHLHTLRLRAQEEARRFLARVLDAGIDARIISGSRSYTEQDELYRRGRWGNPGPIVTNARGGRSNHNFGIAWDIGIFSASSGYVTSQSAYDRAATVGLKETLEWGGNWARFRDAPNYQLRAEPTLAQIRARFEAGDFTLV